MIGSMCLFTFLIVGYDYIFLGRVLPGVGKADMILPLSIVFHSIVALALGAFFRANRADPGKLPVKWQHFVASSRGKVPILVPQDAWQPAKATMCRRCRWPRPERAHHCRFCDACILRYDHHCPWIANCVGFHNHKFFLQAMAYGAIAAFFALLSMLPSCFQALWAMVQSFLAIQNLGDFFNSFAAWKVLRPCDLLTFYVLNLLASLLFIALGWLTNVHMQLALMNYTTVEGSYDNIENPYDAGSALGNLTEIFGTFGWDWFFPVRPLRPVCDGVAWGEAMEVMRVGRNPQSAPDCEGLLPALAMGEEDVEDMEACEENFEAWRARYHKAAPLEEGGGTPRPGGFNCNRLAGSEDGSAAFASLTSWLGQATSSPSRPRRRSNGRGGSSPVSMGRRCAGVVGLAADEGSGDEWNCDEDAVAGHVPHRPGTIGGGGGGSHSTGGRAGDRVRELSRMANPDEVTTPDDSFGSALENVLTKVSTLLGVGVPRRGRHEKNGKHFDAATALDSRYSSVDDELNNTRNGAPLLPSVPPSRSAFREGRDGTSSPSSTGASPTLKIPTGHLAAHPSYPPNLVGGSDANLKTYQLASAPASASNSGKGSSEGSENQFGRRLVAL